MTTTTSAETLAPPRVLLTHHLRQLKLPTVLREYEKVAAEAARDGQDHIRYLLRLVELELIDRERRMVERRIRAARFPAVKSFDTFDFSAIPSLNKPLTLELARCEYVVARDNIIALGNSGTGKTHVALALGLAACQRGFSVVFTTAAALVHQLMEARDEKRLLRLQTQLDAARLLIVDELGYVPLSQTGAELLFEVFSRRHERGSTIVTSNLPFDEWTSVFGNQRLTGVNGGAISGRRGGVKPGQLGRDRRHAKGPDRAPLHVGGENLFVGLCRGDFAGLGVDDRLLG
jgi:DNA replication protein DnaC